MTSKEEQSEKVMKLAEAAIEAGDIEYAGAILVADATGNDINDPRVKALISQMQYSQASADLRRRLKDIEHGKP